MKPRAPLAALAALALGAGPALLATACAAPDSALDPASDAAAAIEGLWWVLLVTCSVVFVAVLAGYAWAFVRRRDAPGLHPPEPVGRSMLWIVVAGAVVPGVILAGLTAVTLRTSAGIAGSSPPDALEVDVVGHQFWWEIRYPESGVVTANELHLPAGRPARVRLSSADVIHSLWIPRLHGKLDLTPGRTTALVLHPREPGEYRGFCAEFCGIQHALMALRVVAMPEAGFEAWLADQARPAAAPTSALAARGEALFRALDCHLCHRVRGSAGPGAPRGGPGVPAPPAGGPTPPATVGPDLTHLASRATLGAAVVENAPGTLAAWIHDPHAIKPGVRMPPSPLSEEDMAALVAYLGGLR